MFVGNIARPVSIIATSLSAAIVPAVIVYRMAPDRLDLSAAALFVGALYAGVGGLYWGKVFENKESSKHDAQVKVAEAQAAAPAPAAPVSAPTDGELPASERIP